MCVYIYIYINCGILHCTIIENIDCIIIQKYFNYFYLQQYGLIWDKTLNEKKIDKRCIVYDSTHSNLKARKASIW